MAQRRIGLWFIGACGGVAGTTALGIAALARGLTSGAGLVTALPRLRKTRSRRAVSFRSGRA